MFARLYVLFLDLISNEHDNQQLGVHRSNSLKALVHQPGLVRRVILSALVMTAGAYTYEFFMTLSPIYAVLSGTHAVLTGAEWLRD